MNELNLNIGGMGCGRCVAKVKTALEHVPGVTVQQVNVGSAQVQYDPSQTSPQAITAAIGQAGYSTTAAAAPTH